MISSILNRPFLGYATNMADVIQINQDTGIMCIAIGGAYILSLLSLAIQKRALPDAIIRHFSTILMWLGIGSYMLLESSHKLFSLSTLRALAGVLAGMAISTLSTLFRMKIPTKKNSPLQYPQNSRLSPKATPHGILECSFLNERILWFIILFRALVTLRAFFLIDT